MRKKNISSFAFAVTKDYGSIFRISFAPHRTIIQCLAPASLWYTCHGTPYEKERYLINHNEECLGYGSSYGLIIYQRSRPMLKSAGETFSSGHFLETREIIGIFKEEEQAKWFSFGIKWEMFSDSQCYQSLADQLTREVLVEWLKVRNEFVPDKEILVKYRLT